VGRALGPDDVVVVLIPDSGRGYLSKLYDDDWMTDHGFLRARGETVEVVLANKGDRLPPLVHVHPEETVRTAIAILEEYEVVGSVSDRLLLQRSLNHPEVFDQPVESVMEPPLATIGQGETVAQVADRLAVSPAVIVLDGGHPIGILTRSDVLSYLERS
jgi:cystathionine beta-synthase